MAHLSASEQDASRYPTEGPWPDHQTLGPDSRPDPGSARSRWLMRQRCAHFLRHHGSMRQIPARRVARELLKQRTVTGVFAGSAVFVIVHTVLLSVHELFPGGARIGDVAFELALAYIGAWIFNLLVIVVPRLHDRDRVLDGTGRLVSGICGVGLAMPVALARGAQIETPQEKVPSEEWLAAVGKRLPLDGPAPLVVPQGQRWRAATWQEWVRDAVVTVESLNALLVPDFPFLEVELIVLVNDVVLSNFITQGRMLASLPSGMSGDMSTLARPLAQFTEACASLRAYYEKEIGSVDSAICHRGHQ